MTGLAEWIAGRIYALRITSWQQWTLRLLMVAAGIGASWLAHAWVSAVVAQAWVGVAAVLLLAAVLRPDSVLPLCWVGFLALTWMGGGGVGPWWRSLAIVALVALFHVLASFAATSPTFSVITRRAAGRLAVGGAAFVLLSTVLAGLVLGSMHV